jgi:UDP-3-O-acyl-N-acetylglucosamine deacetylase
VGLEQQDQPAQYWTATEEIVVEDGDKKLILTPCDHLEIEMKVDFGASPLYAQDFSLTVNRDTFAKELSGARTFCPYKELEQVIAAGLAKGGSLDNAIILHEGALISKDGLRYPNELVRHKIMDMVGDIYLVGKRVRAHISSVKSGHPTHVKLAQAMLQQSAKNN